jgi:hypothetical protein
MMTFVKQKSICLTTRLPEIRIPASSPCFIMLGPHGRDRVQPFPRSRSRRLSHILHLYKIRVEASARCARSGILRAHCSGRPAPERAKETNT